MRNRFSRRGFLRHALRGAGGVTVGLPLLELTAGTAWAQSAPAEKRFIVMFSHGGEIQCRSRTGERANGAFGDTHIRFDDWAPIIEQEALTPDMLGATHRGVFDTHLQKMLLLRGIDNRVAINNAPYNGGHNYANVTALSAASFSGADDGTTSLGPSIDTVIAQRLGTSPLRLTVQGHNYGSPFFQASQQRSEGTQDVRGAFDSLFSNLPANPTDQPDPAALRRNFIQRSVLDGVASGLSLFRGKVSASDFDIIDAHLESIRALERRIEDYENHLVCSAPEIGAIDGLNPAQNQEIAGPLMVDILLKAIACGRAQVGCIEIGDLITTWLGDPWNSAFGIGHSLHHASGDVGPGGIDEYRVDVWRNEMLDNRRWRLSLLARLMDGLASMQEGDATALDNSLLLYTSEFSAATYHSSVDLPVLLAGSAGGHFRTGRHIDFSTSNRAEVPWASNASTHNLYTSVLQAFDQTDTRFGSDDAIYDGPLSDLT